MSATLPISEEELLAWLRQNPDFFTRHPDLLPAAASSNVISLGAGRLDLLSRQNGDLREQLSHMEETVRRNEEIYRAMHRIKLAMVAALDLTDLALTVTHALERTFAIDRVTLMILADAPVWEGGTPAVPEVLADRVMLLARRDIPRTFGSKMKTVIRIGLEGEHNRVLFFGSWAGRIRSEALIPLRVGPDLVGSLNLGSAAPTRFLPSQSTDLVRDLADILTLCLFNATLNLPVFPSSTLAAP